MSRDIIIITGGRSFGLWKSEWPDSEFKRNRISQYKHIFNMLDMFLTEMDRLEVPFELVHGACTGVDTVAGIWANQKGIKVHEVPALWFNADGTYNRSAGNERNAIMLRECITEAKQRFGPNWQKHLAVIAFHGNQGTAHMKSIARQHEVKVSEFSYLGNTY